MFVIAGVTGHVGGAAARELIQKGQKIKVIVRDAAKASVWSSKGAEIAVGQLGDSKFLTTALKGATGFFTLLPPNLGAPDIYAEQRKTADAIASAVRASGVPHVVVLSSVGADLDYGNGPIKGLNYLEHVLRGTGTKLTAIRAGYFQENVQNALDAAKNLGIYPNFSPSADYPMPMIATKDIGALAARSLMQPPAKSEIVDLHGPSYSIRQVAEKVGAALKKEVKVVDVPEKAWVPTMVQAGMPQHAAEVFAEMYAGFASGRIQPKGDRMVQGTTTLDEVLKNLI